MRALLLNDTRSNQHIGCTLVVENTLAQCRRVGIDVIATVPHQADDVTARMQRLLPAFDVLLINGEGTMHDDRPRALALAEAARRAKRGGKRVILYNTVWQNNRELNRYLGDFDLVFCRESLSAARLALDGCRARTVPDMVFATEVPAALRGQRGTGIAMLDSVYRDLTLAMARTAARRGYAFLPMSQESYERIRRRWVLRACLGLRCPEPLQPPGKHFLERLARRTVILSPRFHGTCLAFLLDKPVVSVASNTHKLAGLYQDIGLDPALVVPLEHLKGVLGDRELSSAAERVHAQMPKVRAYIASARRQIVAMFDEVRQLAGAPPAAA